MSDVSPAPPASEIGPIARVPGVLFSPGPTFASIARRPSWLAPLILWTAISVAVTAVILPRVDYEKAVRASFEKRGQTISEDRLQSIVESQQRFAPKLYGAIAVVTPALIALLVAAVYWGAFKAFGWDGTFGQFFGVTTHAFVPGMLGSVLLLPILAQRETVDPQALGDIVLSNLGFLVDRDSSKVLHSLLQSMDVFSFWSLALLVVGFSAATKVSRSSAAGIIVTMWFLYVLGKAALAGLL